MRLVVIPFAPFAPFALVIGLALPAQAQLIQRSGDKGAPVEDDDILAPEKTQKQKDAEKAKEREAKPKQFKVGVVGLVPLGEAGKTVADQVTQGVLKEMNAGTVFDAVPLAVDVKGGAVIDEAGAKKALDDANAAFERGKQLLDKLQFGKARKAFEQALASYEKAAPVLADAQPLFDTRVALAEVAARQGQDDETAIQLAYAASLSPEQDLDKKRYPNQFIRAHQKVRDRVMKDQRASVIVDASGTGANVEIDGRPTAPAPVKVTELPQGRHLLRAVREGLPAFGTIIDVKPGAELTVSPGFIAKDGTSYVDDLQNNRLSPAAAKSVAEAAKAAGLRAAVIGVTSKGATTVPTQLVLVDANSGAVARLPQLNFTGDLLDLSIEALKAREAAETLLEKNDPKAFSGDAIAAVLEGAKAGAKAEMATVALRFDVKAVKEAPKSRLVTGDEKPSEDGEDGAIDDDGRTVLSAGKSGGRRQRLDDEDDPYRTKSPGVGEPADPDAPLTEQPWFWPTVIGGGAAAVVVVGAGTVVTLVGLKVLPDPRPTSGGEVRLALP